MGARSAAGAAGVVAAVLLAGCVGEGPPSPLASIPRLLVDFTNNTTVLYLTSSLGTDVRYGNLTLVLHNDNMTGSLTFHESKSFALVARTNQTFFALNASADESGTHYAYNATMHIALRPGATTSETDDYQIFIRETANGPIQQASLPYKHILQ